MLLSGYHITVCILHIPLDDGKTLSSLSIYIPFLFILIFHSCAASLRISSLCKAQILRVKNLIFHTNLYESVYVFSLGNKALICRTYYLISSNKFFYPVGTPATILAIAKRGVYNSLGISSISYTNPL